MSNPPESPKGQQLARLPDRTHSQPASGPLGIPFLTRLRNASYARDFRSYADLERAANEHLTELIRQVELKGQLLARTEFWRGQASKLEVLREWAANRVEIEAAEFYREAAIRATAQDLELLRLQRLLAEERAKADAPVPQSATDVPRTVADELRSLLAEINEVARAFDDYIAATIEEANGEEHLSDEARQHVENLRLLKADKIQTLYEQAR